MVTTPTVSSPILLAIPATTGAAPVPVPPPIPAVTNTIFVPSLSSCSSCSTFVSASERPTSGLLPAPRPAPSCTFTGTSMLASCLLSVLQAANVTPSMPSLYMLFTALQPPPPTPITLMMCCILSSVTSKNGISPSSIISSFIVVMFCFGCEVTKHFPHCKIPARLAIVFSDFSGGFLLHSRLLLLPLPCH